MPTGHSRRVNALACPVCGGRNTTVAGGEVNASGSRVLRRRKCTCGHSFQTLETIYDLAGDHAAKLLLERIKNLLSIG